MGRRSLTRREQQARTRSSLMESAARVFARRGLAHASIDEVAGDAGFTKGAFYANFANKEELFLAMLDQRFAERLQALERLMDNQEEIEEQARQGGSEFIQYVSADPEWQRLFFEFSAYAARNERFRQELVQRYGALRERMTDLFRRRVKELEITPPVELEQVALMTFAMANGVALEKLLEPEAVPADLYASMLMIFFTGLRALAGPGERAAETGPPDAARMAPA